MIRWLGSKVVYRSRWMVVRADEVEFADGGRGVYSIVEKPDYALIVPRAGDTFYLIRQRRYTVGRPLWEFPQGANEDTPDQDPGTLARQELKEETGLSAETMTPLGQLYPAYGYSSQRLYLFVAEGLTPGEPQRERGEEGMEVGTFSLAQFEDMLRNGEIQDSATTAAYGLLKLRGLA